MYFGILSLLLLVSLKESASWNVQDLDKKLTHNINSNKMDDSSDGVPKNTCQCGWSNKKMERIFGGEETIPNEFPFVSGITRSSMRLIFCGSTIITPYHALTAAHCFYNKTRFGPFVLVIGEHDVRTESETALTEDIPIKKYILHEDYNPSNYLNDISLIILEKEIKFSKLIGPVCLPTKEPFNPEKQLVTIIGWGRTPTNPHGSPVLQKVDLIVLPRDKCTRIMTQFYPASGPNQLCTYGTQKSACSGDSGGPLVWLNPTTNRYTLIGIVSFGTKQCAGPIPRVATEVSKYLDWIQNQLRENGPIVNICSKES